MRKSRLNFMLPLAITFILMVLVVIYTSRLFYRISVSNLYEVGQDKISGTSASLGNYLDTTRSVVWVTADSVDYMIRNEEKQEVILDFIIQETVNHKMQFDENYTGLYGYIRGEYLDGLEWQPPEGYDPTERDWYKLAKAGGGKMIIVPPYVDAQTGSMVISVCKLLSDGESVLALDVYTNHIQDVISDTDIKGKGYGFILNKEGTVVAHRDTSLNGIDFHTVDGGAELLDKLRETDSGYFETQMNGKLYTVFVNTIMDQWYLLIAVETEELFTDVYSQLAVNVATYVIVFVLIALFYIISYRNERKISREAETLKISEQQKAYEAELLRVEKAAADSANQAKGDFLAQMSHEIRTPINAVLGMNEMILQESEDQKILDYSESIQTAGRTLLLLINSILDFSKIEEGKMEIIPVKYETAEMVNNLIHSVAERAKAKGLELILKIDPQLPRMMVGDDVRLSQVIMNLLTNAVKYTEKGSVILEISGLVKTEKEITLGVAVKDTGIGIRAEDMDKMFESFSRLEEKRNRNIEGTGLGMAIVTRLLDLMGSKLNVESVYGKGSAFSFEVKQEIADEKPVGDISEQRIEHTQRKKKVYRQFTGANILVTDDNDTNLKVAQNLLRLLGIKADTVSSGTETIEQIGRKHYDIVFLDHMMPGMDGIETIEELRSRGLIPADTAVIALTANAVSGAREMYLKAGFCDYLTKPIEMDCLEEMLAKYLPAKDECVQEASQIAEDPLTKEEEILEFLPVDEEMQTHSRQERYLIQLEEAGFSVKSGLKYCADDPGFYCNMLREYAESGAEKQASLQEALVNQDHEHFGVIVHALKSLSKTIGADDVSELARTLENAAKEMDHDFLKEHYPELAEAFKKRTEEIKRILEI